jgi:hypothetical protein
MPDPFMTSLFSGGDASPKSPEALYSQTIGLFPSGSYQPNPVNDPESAGRDLATWWKNAWDGLRNNIGARKKLPPDAARINKDALDNKAAEITEKLQGLESAKNKKDRRGYADLALRKLIELQAELPLDGLAAVPRLQRAANAFRDASFTVGKAIVARTLNDDRPTGENLRDTYRQLQLRETAATHYWIGGDPPQSLEIPKNRDAYGYLDVADENISVPSPIPTQRNAAFAFERVLVDYRDSKQNVDGLRGQPDRDDQQDRALVTADGELSAHVDAIANLTRAFARQTADLVAKDPKGDAVVQSAELAMVVAEAMRNVTGVIRPGAQPSAKKALSQQEIDDRGRAGRHAASEMPEKFAERAREERGLSTAMSSL